jgi:hypothetical protein
VGKHVRTVKITEQPYGIFVSQETPMDTQWPAGDPCPNDKETLVVFQTREYSRGYTQKEN